MLTFRRSLKSFGKCHTLLLSFFQKFFEIACRFVRKISVLFFESGYQRWSRGYKGRGQGQGPRTLTQVFSKKKGPQNFFFSQSQKKGLQKFFSGEKRLQKFCFRRSLLEETKKRSLQIFRKVSGVFQRNFNGSKIVLSSSRGQGNFRALEASRPRPGLQNVSSRTSSRPRTSSMTPPLVATQFTWHHSFI